MRKCTKCKITKEMKLFSRDASRTNGFSYTCKDCASLYKIKNKVKLTEYMHFYYKEYALKYKEEIAKYTKKYAQENKEKIKQYQDKYKIENKDKIQKYYKVYNKNYKLNNKEYFKNYIKEKQEYLSQYKKAYGKENKDKISKAYKEYSIKNRPKLNEKHARRRAKKLRATPKWLTKLHISQMIEIYKKANELKYDVDHIIPLYGKYMSGLHVPWNLRLLPSLENVSRPRNIKPFIGDIPNE
jgi:hypothetical protein